MRGTIVGAWRRLSGPQRAVVIALAAVAALLGVSEMVSWAESSLGRPRYEVVWEAALPESHRAHATVTKDGQYAVVLQTSSFKQRAYKLSPSGQIQWQLEFAPKSFAPSSGIYNESLDIWGVIPTADGGVMVHGAMRRVFTPGYPNIENNAYVASIGSDGALHWQKEFQPTGRTSAGSFGFSGAVPIAAGGLFFGSALGRPPQSKTNEKMPRLAISWWTQLDADGRVVAEHFDLEAERSGFDTRLAAPVWADGILFALRGGRRTVDLATHREMPFGTDAFESIVALDPVSGAVTARADLPYSCTTLEPVANGVVLRCYDQKVDLAVANGLAVWLDSEFKIVANPVVWDRNSPRQGIAGKLFVPNGTALIHSADSPGSAVGGQQVRVGMLNQSGQIIVQRKFRRLFWHSRFWDLIRGLEADTLLLVRTEYSRFDLPYDGRTVATLLRFVR